MHEGSLSGAVELRMNFVFLLLLPLHLVSVPAWSLRSSGEDSSTLSDGPFAVVTDVQNGEFFFANWLFFKQMYSFGKHIREYATKGRSVAQKKAF